MISFLARIFIKDRENTESSDTRTAYGTLCGVMGIIFNIILFAIKLFAGILSGAISVISDAFNNLTDAASSVITLLGFRMANQKADKDHPFGHGRMEYLTSLIIAAVILLMGVELFRDSVGKIIHPEEVKFRVIVLVSLILSVAVKLWMARFNTILGRKISSTAMLATAKDSRNDVIATIATIISLVASLFTDLPVDGVMGIIVSVFVLKAGLEIIMETVDELLGKPADPETVKEITRLVCCDDRIQGIHDLIIHSYGPGNMIGSCHAEVRSDEDFMVAHDLIDRIERDIHKQLKIAMTIHMDPIETNNEQVNTCRMLVSRIVKSISGELSIHDFRIVTGDTHTNLIFDVVVPYGFGIDDDGIKEEIDRQLACEAVKYYTVITFDHDYT